MQSAIRIVPLILLVVAMAACDRDITSAVETDDGLAMVYERFGDGDTTVVFVHCWGCNREFWRDQVGPVVDAGYQVVTVDLPGHGASDADREQWTIAGLADDLTRLIEELDLSNVILIGHSMGGPLSLITARQARDRVIGIGCVDTLHNAEYQWPEELAEMFTEQLRADFQAGIESFLPQMLPADADPEVTAWILEQALAADQEALLQLMSDYSGLQLAALMKGTEVPIRCINAVPFGPQAMATETAINQRYSDFDVVLMDGVGHYPQLEQPEAFNAHLLDVLDMF